MDLAHLLAYQCPTIKHVPLALQQEWDRVLSACIHTYCEDRADISLYGLMALPKLVLNPPRVKGRHSKDNTIAVVRERLVRFVQGDWGSLWAELTKAYPGPHIATRGTS